MKKRAGFSLVEVIVALMVFAILAAGVFNVVTNSYRNFYGTGDKQAITEYAQEAVEAVRSIRDNGWQAIEDVSEGGNQGLTKNVNSYWQFSGSSDTFGALTRVVVITDVERDSNDNIVESGGSNDPNTKQVTVTVSGDGIDDYVLTTYITNWAYRSWDQSDWSGVGDREFWSSIALASSSVSNINTTTAQEITLSFQDPPGDIYGDWVDFGAEVTFDLDAAWRPIYDLVISPDGKTLYAGGSTNTDIRAYDIEYVHTGIITELWRNSMDIEVYAMEMHPNGKYIYIGNSDLDKAETSTQYWIEVIDASDGSLVGGVLTDDYIDDGGGRQDDMKCYDMVINADASELYAVSSYGGFYAYDISADGSTLTPQVEGGGGDDSIINNSWYKWAWPNKMWLDESGATPYVYIVSDYSTYAISKWDISDPTSPALEYRYTGVNDYDDIAYLGNDGGNIFAVSSEDGGFEMQTFKDTGSGFTQLDSLDPGTASSPGLIYDGDGSIILYGTGDANLYEIDVTDPTDISAGISDTSTYYINWTTSPHHYAEYSDKLGGFFFVERDAGNLNHIHWIARPETRQTGTGYDYKRTITIDSGSTKVISGPHSNFPLLISETEDYLKTETNGGNVQDDNGYDIIFTSDSAGQTILDYEIEKYSSSTGELVAWVGIPSLASNTDIYMFYGNGNVPASQERPTDVWSDYQMVHHMADLDYDLIRDSTSNANEGDKFISPYDEPVEISAGCKIGLCQSYDGTDDEIRIENSDNPAYLEQGTSDFTVDFWIKPNSSQDSYSTPVFFGGAGGATQAGWNIRHRADSGAGGWIDRLYFHMADGSNSLGGMYTNNPITDNIWTHVALVATRDTGYQYYINSNTDNSYDIDTSGNDIDGYAQKFIGRDWSITYDWYGEIDEVRLRHEALSQEWLQTEYNNMNATSTFYSIGDSSPASGYNSPGYLYSSIYDIGSSGKELSSVSVKQNVPTGCGLNIDLQTSDDITFATYASENFDDISTSYYTSTTPAILNGQRFLRYKVNMTACNDNADTPTLYSVKFTYK